MDTQNKKPKAMKRAIILIVVLALILVGIVLWQKKLLAPTSENSNEPNTEALNNSPQDASVLNAQLDSININDLNQEFQSIDQDLKSL